MAKQRLLISIRGPKEAKTAIKGGAHIVDVEFPASALGTPLCSASNTPSNNETSCTGKFKLIAILTAIAWPFPPT